MPRKAVVQNQNIVQSDLDYYFPKKNWLPPMIAREQQDIGDDSYLPISRIVIFGSCVWCGCAVEQGHWRNHINYHRNTT